MLVFFEERLAFLSVPKTGTTAYETALAPRADMVISEPPMLKHAPVYRYNRFIRPMYERVFGVELGMEGQPVFGRNEIGDMARPLIRRDDHAEAVGPIATRG